MSQQLTGMAELRRRINWIIEQIKCLKDQGCLCEYEETDLTYDPLTGILSSTYVDGSVQGTPLNIPTNTSNLTNDGEDGVNSFITLLDLPNYTVGINTNTSIFSLFRNGIEISTADLSYLLDDTNLARIVSGTLNGSDELILTRDDATEITINLSNLRVTSTSELTNDGEDGVNPFITANDIPAPVVYTIDLNLGTNTLTLLADAVAVDTVDLSSYLDNTNLARITSGNYSWGSQTLTLVRDDLTTIDIDLSDINTEFGNLQTLVNNNTTAIGVNAGNISSNASDIATNTSDIAALQSGSVPNTRQINTIHSVTGGGDLSADRTLSLVNDITAPGTDKMYGTNAAGTKGWHNVVRENYLDLSGRWGCYNDNRWVGPSTSFGHKQSNMTEDFGTGATPILIFDNIGFGYLPVGTVLQNIEFIGKVNNNQVTGIEVYTSVIGANFNSGGYTLAGANQVSVNTTTISVPTLDTINRSLINLNYTLTENRIIMVNIRPIGVITGGPKRWNVIGKLNYRLP